MARGGKNVEIKFDKRVLTDLITQSPRRAQTVIAKTAADVQGYAQTHMNTTAPDPAPAGEFPAVQTGNLKNSILAVQISAFVWAVIVRQLYGLFLELGTSEMAARPFLRPSVSEIAKLLPKVLRAKVIERR